MEYVYLGRTGMKVSRLAFGTMSFGGDADDSEAAAMFGRCRDAGINLFDCADVYNAGRAEELLGRLTQSCRDEVILTTKAYFPTGDGPNDRGSSRYHLVRAVEASLKRLGTDRIDLFFLHRYDDNAALDETLRAIDDLIAQGKILNLAVSNFAAWETMKALGIQDQRGWQRLCAVQPMYNLVKRQAEAEIFPLAQAEGLAAFPYNPLGAGLLAGRYGKDRRPDSGRIVDNGMYGTRYGDPGIYECADRFVALAKARDLHPVTLALAWVAAHPAVTAPLIGARNTTQLEPALKALDVEMTAELYQEIAGLWPSPPPATDRNEERSSFNYSAVLRK